MGIKSKILNCLPFFFHKKLEKRNVIGGYYHLINDDNLGYVTPIFSYKNRQQFEEDLFFLKRNYSIITYEDFVDKNVSSSANFMLTFDDGYRELKTVILPLLEKHNIPAIYFITTSLIDNQSMMYRNLIALIISVIEEKSESYFQGILSELERVNQQKFGDKKSYFLYLKSLYNNEDKVHLNAEIAAIDTKEFLEKQKPYLTTAEILELHRHPLITIGAHSTKHYKLGLMTDEQIEEDIVTSCKIIKQITQQQNVPFAFPFTSENVKRKILKKITQENSWINGFFGEFNYDFDDVEVIKRYPLDHPDFSLKKRIRHEAIHYLYHKK